MEHIFDLDLENMKPVSRATPSLHPHIEFSDDQSQYHHHLEVEGHISPDVGLVGTLRTFDGQKAVDKGRVVVIESETLWIGKEPKFVEAKQQGRQIIKGEPIPFGKIAYGSLRLPRRL